MKFIVDAQLPPALARKQPLLEKFDTLLPAILAALDRGETLIELI
ncbi:MAG: hypothetical protein Q8J96_03795 [Rhodocyclaceae bacterium]|nr:hypothetical protein [Rhodocyclaceae bacterium]MDP3030696.1 hypothetical protein [Rhodocyclaceae bacterium]